MDVITVGFSRRAVLERGRLATHSVESLVGKRGRRRYLFKASTGNFTRSGKYSAREQKHFDGENDDDDGLRHVLIFKEENQDVARAFETSDIFKEMGYEPWPFEKEERRRANFTRL